MQTGIDVHNIKDKIPRISLQSQGGLNSPVAFAHNGVGLIGACDTGKVRLWASATGERMQTLNHSGELTPLSRVLFDSPFLSPRRHNRDCSTYDTELES